MATEQCEATHVSPTATGEVKVRCVLPRGHGGRHQAKVGVFPINWD